MPKVTRLGGASNNPTQRPGEGAFFGAAGDVRGPGVASEVEGPAAAVPPEPAVAGPSYEDWSRHELVEETGRRRLSTVGAKAALIARLRVDDRRHRE